MAFLVCLLVACLAASTSASCCAGMTMNALGIELTESSEGYVDHVYNDAAGVRKQPAICRSQIDFCSQHHVRLLPVGTWLHRCTAPLGLHLLCCFFACLALISPRRTPLCAMATW
jgi:hypothetical protein